MTRNGSADADQHSVETNAVHVTPTSGGGSPRTGSYTVTGAAVVAMVPPAVVAAASFPTAAAVVLTAVVATVVVREVTARRRTPDRPKTKSGPDDAGPNQTVTPAD